MRIALIDHSFRQTTKSVEFLYEILRSVGSLSLFYDESWRGGPNAWRTTFDESDYDLVVIVQAHWAFDFLSGKHQNVVFIPMYDAMFSESGFVWKSEFSNAKCVSFSRKLHQEIANRNGLSGYFKYFPDPSQFGVVSDFDQIRPFFWYRRSDITPDYVLELCRETDLRTLTLHNAPDPKQPPLWLSKLPPNLSDIKITTWWKDTADYRNALLEHNIFFAPRISEGIGASFIEAMASGLCVVGRNFPTMNEYIADGTNGLLYSLDQKPALNFTHAKELGARARETVERGFADWQRQVPELIDFLSTPKSRLSASKGQRGTGRPPQPPPAKATPAIRSAVSGGSPKVSVVTVCLNAAEDLPLTIESVLSQDWPNVEYIIMDGASTDKSVQVIKSYADSIAFWRSEPDEGVFHAMNDAINHCTGDWIMFMNAGDTFIDTDAISRLLRHAPSDAHIVYGHHFYAAGDDLTYMPAADFRLVWSRIRRGELGFDWGGIGLPCHQATAVRHHLLQKLRFDTRFHLAADHHFLIRAFRTGATFFHSDEPIAVYRAGGLSAKYMSVSRKEWQQLAREYGSLEGAALLGEFVEAEDAELARQVRALRDLVSETEDAMDSLAQSRVLKLVSRGAPRVAKTMSRLRSLVERMRQQQSRLPG